MQKRLSLQVIMSTAVHLSSRTGAVKTFLIVDSLSRSTSP
jgi:hypothetical protein